MKLIYPQICLFVLLLCSSLFGQELARRNTEDYTVVAKCVRTCSYERIKEISFDIATILRQGNNVTIRICSNKKFEAAISEVSGSLIELMENLRKLHHFDPTNIVVLLANGCSESQGTSSIMEVLEVKTDVQLSGYTKKTTFGNISIIPLNKMPFRAKLAQFAMLLKKNHRAYGTVYGFYYRTPSKGTAKKLMTAKRYLNNISKIHERFDIRPVPIGVTFDPPEPEPNDVIFQLIEIKHS